MSGPKFAPSAPQFQTQQNYVKMSLDFDHTICIILTGVLPELVAKWIASQAILPAMLCLAEDAQDPPPDSDNKGEEVPKGKKLDQPSPIIGESATRNHKHEWHSISGFGNRQTIVL